MMTAVMAVRAGNVSNKALVKKVIGFIVVVVVCVAVVVVVLKVLKTFGDSSSDSKKEKTFNEGTLDNLNFILKLQYSNILRPFIV